MVTIGKFEKAHQFENNGFKYFLVKMSGHQGLISIHDIGF